MAKTKQEIIERLIASLEHGDGDLDELDKLMDKAKQDIDLAKQAEVEEKKRKEQETVKRGEAIAEMATRVLNDKATEADVAMVMESYMHSLGMKDAKVSADEVREAKETAEKAANTMGDLLNALGGLAKVFDQDFNKESQTITKKPPRNADDVLREFLKSI